MFCDKIRKILSECGVVIVYLPYIEGTFLHGASFIDGNRIVMALAVLGKNSEDFWSSFFHELYHVLKCIIHNDRAISSEEEREADAFARDILIKPDDYNVFIENKDYSKAAIIAFSRKEAVAKGIVLGRLQKDGFVKYNKYNDLKEQYAI